MKIVILVMALSVSAFGQKKNDNGVGNGGDLLRTLFEAARTSGGQKVLQVKPCSFSSDVPKNVRDWILDHRPDYASDMLRSQQVWITDNQPTCAWTQVTDASDITLSFEACRPLVINELKAAHILFHESVHHFGISDESFAEAVANAMDSATVGITCPVDPQDPFSPDACSGNPISAREFLDFFKPGGDKVRVGYAIPMSYRSRRCLGPTEDLCTEWAYTRGYVSDVVRGGWTTVPFELGADFSISDRTMNVDLVGNGGYPAIIPLKGVGTKEISADHQALTWSKTNPLTGGSYGEFHGKGRLTKDCLVLKYRHDIEYEMAVLIPFH